MENWTKSIDISSATIEQIPIFKTLECQYTNSPFQFIGAIIMSVYRYGMNNHKHRTLVTFDVGPESIQASPMK